MRHMIISATRMLTACLLTSTDAIAATAICATTPFSSLRRRRRLGPRQIVWDYNFHVPTEWLNLNLHAVRVRLGIFWWWSFSLWITCQRSEHLWTTLSSIIINVSPVHAYSCCALFSQVLTLKLVTCVDWHHFGAFDTVSGIFSLRQQLLQSMQKCLIGTDDWNCPMQMWLTCMQSQSLLFTTTTALLQEKLLFFIWDILLK